MNGVPFLVSSENSLGLVAVYLSLELITDYMQMMERRRICDCCNQLKSETAVI